jgi:hypothetical protein
MSEGARRARVDHASLGISIGTDAHRDLVTPRANSHTALTRWLDPA